MKVKPTIEVIPKKRNRSVFRFNIRAAALRML